MGEKSRVLLREIHKCPADDRIPLKGAGRGGVPSGPCTAGGDPRNERIKRLYAYQSRARTVGLSTHDRESLKSNLAAGFYTQARDFRGVCNRGIPFERYRMKIRLRAMKNMHLKGNAGLTPTTHEGAGGFKFKYYKNCI